MKPGICEQTVTPSEPTVGQRRGRGLGWSACRLVRHLSGNLGKFLWHQALGFKHYERLQLIGARADRNDLNRLDDKTFQPFDRAFDT